MSASSPTSTGRNAFSSPTSATLQRLGRRSNSRLRNRDISDTISDAGSNAQSCYSRTSRRSSSILRSTEDYERFDQLSTSTSVLMKSRRKQRLSDEKNVEFDITKIPVVDVVEGALSFIRSLSPASKSAIVSRIVDDYTPGLPEHLQRRNDLDLRNNDNSFHVMASLLVDFFHSRLDEKTVTLQPGDRKALERLLPDSARIPFIDAVRYRLEQTPSAPRTPLHFIVLQCQELGLDADGDRNPIIAASTMTTESPIVLPFNKILDNDDELLQTSSEGTKADLDNSKSSSSATDSNIYDTREDRCHHIGDDDDLSDSCASNEYGYDDKNDSDSVKPTTTRRDIHIKAEHTSSIYKESTRTTLKHSRHELSTETTHKTVSKKMAPTIEATAQKVNQNKKDKEIKQTESGIRGDELNEATLIAKQYNESVEEKHHFGVEGKTLLSRDRNVTGDDSIDASPNISTLRVNELTTLRQDASTSPLTLIDFDAMPVSSLIDQDAIEETDPKSAVQQLHVEQLRSEIASGKADHLGDNRSNLDSATPAIVALKIPCDSGSPKVLTTGFEEGGHSRNNAAAPVIEPPTIAEDPRLCTSSDVAAEVLVSNTGKAAHVYTAHEEVSTTTTEIPSSFDSQKGIVDDDPPCSRSVAAESSKQLPEQHDVVVNDGKNSGLNQSCDLGKGTVITAESLSKIYLTTTETAESCVDEVKGNFSLTVEKKIQVVSESALNMVQGDASTSVVDKAQIDTMDENPGGITFAAADAVKEVVELSYEIVTDIQNIGNNHNPGTTTSTDNETQALSSVCSRNVEPEVSCIEEAKVESLLSAEKKVVLDAATIDTVQGDAITCTSAHLQMDPMLLQVPITADATQQDFSDTVKEVEFIPPCTVEQDNTKESPQYSSKECLLYRDDTQRDEENISSSEFATTNPVKLSPAKFASQATIEWFSSLFSSSVRTAIDKSEQNVYRKKRFDAVPSSVDAAGPAYSRMDDSPLNYKNISNPIFCYMDVDGGEACMKSSVNASVADEFQGEVLLPSIQATEVERTTLAVDGSLPLYNHDAYNTEAEPNSIAKQQLLIELREASNLMVQSKNQETAHFWRNHVLDLQARLQAIHDDLTSKINSLPYPSPHQKSIDILETNRRLISEFQQREQNNYAPTLSMSGSNEAPQPNQPDLPKNHNQQTSEIPIPEYDLPIVDVIAPADLPGGYHFEAEIEGRRFLATVPAGGVTRGEAFTCYMRELDSVAIDVPVGYWKDDFTATCNHGCMHCVVVNSIFCPLITLGQIQHRTKLDFLGRPQYLNQNGNNVSNRFMMVVFIGFWTFTNLALFGACNLKWSRGLEVTGADISAFALINFAMLGFVIFVTQSTRSTLREKFMIREERCFDLEDLCCAIWCLPCTICQMARHTANYDEYEAVCCSKTGLPTGVRVNEFNVKDPDCYRIV